MPSSFKTLNAVAKMAIERTEVRAFLKNWANTASKPHFAVLIEGRWGCGKTHFVLSLLDDESFTDRKRIYLSTFGMSDVQSLERSLFYASANKLSKALHKGVGFAASIFSGALTIGSGGFFGGTADLNKVVEAASSKLEESAKNIDGALLVLDDLERCQIPMAELLGVVNRFVEHGDTRVILMANTEDLKDEHFSAFREKVIGHSFLLASEPDGALISFVAEISNEQVRAVLDRKKPEIRELYGISGYHNLRALRQYVWQLAAVIERMDEVHRKNDTLLQNLISQFFVFFIEFKLDLSNESMSLRPSDLSGSHDEGRDDARHVYDFSFGKKKEPSQKQKALAKYGLPNGVMTVITIKQWISILTTGVVDSAWLNKELALSNETMSVEAWPSWRRLWHLQYWDFSDGTEIQFWKDVADMEANLRNGSYLNAGEFLHVAGISIMLSDIGLVGKSVAQTIGELKSYIDEVLFPKLTLEGYREFTALLRWDHTSHDGLGFIGSDGAHFLTIRQHLIRRVNDWYGNWLAHHAGVELLGYLTDDVMRFLGNLRVSNYSAEQQFLDVPVLSAISTADFVDALFKLPRNKEMIVVNSLKERYEHHPELLDTEGMWWFNVQEELLLRISDSKSAPRNLQLKGIIDQISSSIIDAWEIRQFNEFFKDKLTDPRWMVRKRVKLD